MTLGVLAIAGSGCSAVVLDGLRDAGAGGELGEETGTTDQLTPQPVVEAGPNPTEVHTALAMRYADVPANTLGQILGPPDGSVTDPNALVLFFVNPGQQCSHPGIASTCPGQAPSATGMATYATVPSQQYILVIPPALDQPGLIDIPANDILSLTSVATPSCNGGGGGGGGGSGTLNIVSSDDTTLSVVLSGTGPALSTGSTGQTSSTDVSTFDGTYSVYRCDAPPPAPAPTAGDASAPATASSTALAMRLSDVPNPAFTAPELLPPQMLSGDPNSLVLYFSNVGQQCASPVVPPTCQPGPVGPSGQAGAPVATQQLMLVIPPNLDAPGLIDMQADQIPFAESAASPTCNGSAGGGGGVVFTGTLDILSSDPTGLSVVLSGTGAGTSNSKSFDGTYTVLRCD
jgi:hypothetical protein